MKANMYTMKFLILVASQNEARIRVEKSTPLKSIGLQREPRVVD